MSIFYGEFGFFFIALLIYIVPFILCIVTQAKVTNTFSKYSAVQSQTGRTASDMARFLIESSNLTTRVTKVGGQLTDYYDPKRNIIALSSDVHDSTSVAALGVMAHELGHALQYREPYRPIVFRKILYPFLNVTSKATWILLILGIIGSFIFPQYSFYGEMLLLSFVILYGITMLIAFLTLPIEKNASGRALRILKSSGALNDQELAQAKEVLDAAALTYVASLLISILYFLRFLLLFLSSRRR